jgi:arylsulfatase A
MALVLSAVTSPPPPLTDDLGMNQIDLPGQPYSYSGVSGAIKTPNLAKFAKEGTTFMAWYSAFHVCTPSRASMMTGRLPIRVGLGDGVLRQDAIGGLQHNETTMAESLGALGYETAMFGKVRQITSAKKRMVAQLMFVA